MNRELHADIVIIGGGLGGCAAALSAAKNGKKVLMTEETDWIGGQLTSQGVPPDEHPWIEQFGCTATYREFREQVRQYYRDHFPLTQEARSNRLLNPGGGWVSRLCHEPKVALAVLQGMLARYVSSGKVVILTKTVPIGASTSFDHIDSITVKSLESGVHTELRGAFFLDATECGDVLPLAGVEYVIGAESQSETSEPHAVTGAAEPMDMQGFTYCFAIDYVEGADYTIDQPRDYHFWKSYQADFWPAKQLSMMGVVPYSLEPIEYGLFDGDRDVSLYTYRQIINKNNFELGTFESSISLINWPQNDYWLGPIIDTDEFSRSLHLDGAKQLSLSLLYWLQTEAPRPDGKLGYPGLRLRPDIMGTEDGLAKYPYIRESRRIKAEFTVLEQHIASNCRPEGKAEVFHDSVGIGCYRIDLHPSTGGRSFIDISTLPFQIPLGSLIPIRIKNLLPASKNIGVTHITNGCYRVHHVEWNIGESAGYLATYCMDHNIEPKEVRNNPEQLRGFQSLLTRAGIELAWPTIRPV